MQAKVWMFGGVVLGIALVGAATATFYLLKFRSQRRLQIRSSTQRRNKVKAEVISSWENEGGATPGTQGTLPVQ